MSTTMKSKIAKTVNSRGLRIPKLLLDKAGLGSEVQIEVKKDKLIISAAKHPRDGWEESAREMAANGDDVLLDPYVPTQFDLEE